MGTSETMQLPVRAAVLGLLEGRNGDPVPPSQHGPVREIGVFIAQPLAVRETVGDSEVAVGLQVAISELEELGKRLQTIVSRIKV